MTRRFPWLLVTITSLVFVFLYVPIVNVVIFSFNSTRSIANFTSPSLTWYRTVLTNDELLASVWLSVRIALVCGIAAVLLGTLLALGLGRMSRREAAAPQLVLGLTFTTPEIAMGVSTLMLFTVLGTATSGITVTIAHITFSLAYVVFVVRARLASLRTDIEEAARDLGASQLGVLRLVILPQLWPAMAVSFIVVFLLSFDDFVVSFFTTGVGTPPLPVHIYGMLKRGITPEVNAIGTLMLAIALVLAGAGWYFAGRSGRSETILAAATRDVDDLIPG